MPHTNDRPPDGVHGAGGGACAAAADRRRQRARDRRGQDALLHRMPPLLRAHCASNALRCGNEPSAARPVARMRAMPDGRGTRGRDARPRRLRDRAGADPRPPVAAPDRRPPDSGGCSSRCRCSALPSLRSRERAAAPVALRPARGRGLCARPRLLALRHRQHLGGQGHACWPTSRRSSSRRRRGCSCTSGRRRSSWWPLRCRWRARAIMALAEGHWRHRSESAARRRVVAAHVGAGTRCTSSR